MTTSIKKARLENQTVGQTNINTCRVSKLDKQNFNLYSKLNFVKGIIMQSMKSKEDF